MNFIRANQTYLNKHMKLYRETQMPRIDNPYECANYDAKIQNLNQTCKKGYNYGRCILYEDVLSCPEFKKKQEVINER